MERDHERSREEEEMLRKEVRTVCRLQKPESLTCDMLSH